ncbi:hypothetical protein V5740_11645 [Croceibacterium sp. TMG7-5b_MA50]|uniref:hypothetical protein n=1 Tax=Croceibacterium sp. TMG7-5b_MA50 TaxID=3121290 RepID=UPI0032215F0B
MHRLSPSLAPMFLLAGCMDATAIPPQTVEANTTCTRDGLVQAEVSTVISRYVATLVTPADSRATLRDAARLTLPCGFTLDARWFQHLIVTDGREVRQYRENNPFGFAVPLGFGQPVTRSYRLQPFDQPYRLKANDCAAELGKVAVELPCGAFGGSLFAAEADPAGGWRLVHYRKDASGWHRMAEAGRLRVRVRPVQVAFIPVPDAPGGTVTLYLQDGEALYRVFLDVSYG